MSEDKVSILAIGAHPDDVELTVGGTLLLARRLGRATAICHATAGELGTRGSREIRAAEARRAADALGAAHLLYLDQPDGHVEVTIAAKRALVAVIRRHRPDLVLAPHWEDLHPDHAATGRLVRESVFLSGLARWDAGGTPWRPVRTLYYMSHTAFAPDLLVDISEVFAEKTAAARCYASQFHVAESTEPETFISRPDFWHWWEARAAWFGHMIGVRHAEPFHTDGPVPTRDPASLFEGFGKYKNA